ncbi:MAG: transcriptional regulator [Treponema sp.]|jgi:hypothetical protein|nr:transcriptional regulator [Treponema sp.]
MRETVKNQAAEDFSRARSKEVFQRIMHFLDNDRTKLLSLNDVKKLLRPKSETYRGMQAVPIQLIVGSEGRYRDFNKYFLPRSEHLRPRWERVDEARLNDITLPPIQLYEIGGVYFVRDGNHRVSVAKTQGVENVDAEVISLSTEISISPSMTVDDLRKALIAYEKKTFFQKTEFEKITGCGGLDFTMPGSYDIIYNHIMVHKYFLNQHCSEEIPFDKALRSWFDNVYKPITDIIVKENLCGQFPGRTPSDLYVWIVKHWDLLKKKYGIHYTILDAARDFGTRYGRRDGRRNLSALILSLVKGIFGKRRH